MALASPQELQLPIADLTTVAQSNTASPDLGGYMARIAIIAKVKEITRSLVSPEQLPNYHGLNVHCSPFFSIDQYLNGFSDG